jgi:hypothetical protein
MKNFTFMPEALQGSLNPVALTGRSFDAAVSCDEPVRKFAVSPIRLS